MAKDAAYSCAVLRASFPLSDSYPAAVQLIPPMNLGEFLLRILYIGKLLHPVKRTVSG